MKNKGRVLIDMYKYIRNQKNNRPNNKLEEVAKAYLNESKENIHYSEIPKLHEGDEITRRKLAVYCLKDAWLPLCLMEERECIQNLT